MHLQLQEWEFFDVEPQADSKVALKGCHGMYMSATDGGGSLVNCGGAAVNAWELLELRHVADCL